MDPQARLARIMELDRELNELLAEEALEKKDTEERILQHCRLLKGRGLVVKAIKYYREMLGGGLLEAKNAIDDL